MQNHSTMIGLSALAASALIAMSSLGYTMAVANQTDLAAQAGNTVALTASEQPVTEEARIEQLGPNVVLDLSLPAQPSQGGNAAADLANTVVDTLAIESRIDVSSDGTNDATDEDINNRRRRGSDDHEHHRLGDGSRRGHNHRYLGDGQAQERGQQ